MSNFTNMKYQYNALFAFLLDTKRPKPFKGRKIVIGIKLNKGGCTTIPNCWCEYNTKDCDLVFLCSLGTFDSNIFLTTI